MTPSEVAKLLTLAAAFDRRTLGPTDVAAWHSLINDLRFAEAEAALKAHYAETDRFAMPSDIRRLAGIARRDAIERRRSAELAIENRERRQTPEEWSRGLAKVRAAFDMSRGTDAEKAAADNAQRAFAYAVACPYCSAKVGAPCVLLDSGQPLRKSIAHASRLVKASE